MRKLACALLVLLTFSGCGKKAEEPQFVCTACHQEFLENGVVTGTDDYFHTYNDQGLITSSEWHQNEVLSFRAVWEYDEFGNIIRVTEEKYGTVTTSDYKNTLDEKGRVLRQEVWIGNTMTSFDEYDYDRRDNQIRHHANFWYEGQEETEWRTYTMSYDWKGNLTRKELRWNFNDEYSIWEYEDGLCISQTSYESETDNVTEYWEYTYDQKDRCIRESQYDRKGRLKLYNEYIYDDTARTMTKTRYNADSTVDRYSNVYTYDEYGNQIMQERYQDGEVYWRVKSTYELLETVAERS